MQVQCTQCGLVMEAPAQYAGMMMACSRCRAQFRVPAAAPAPAPTPGYAPAAGYGGYPAVPSPGYGAAAGYAPPGYAPAPPPPGYGYPAGYGAPPAYSPPPAGYGAPPRPGGGGSPAVIEAEPASANKVAPTKPAGTEPAADNDMPTPSGRIAARSGRYRHVSSGPPASARGMATVLIGGIVVALAGVIGVVIYLSRSGGFSASDPKARQTAETFLAAASRQDDGAVWEMMSSQSKLDFKNAAPQILQRDRAVISATGDDGQVATAYGLTADEIRRFDGKLLLKKLLRKNPPWTSLGMAKIDVVGADPGEKVSRARVIIRIGEGEKRSFQMRHEEGRWTVHLNPDWQ